MLKNNNINNLILNYLTSTDLSRTEQVNKKLNKCSKKFNHIWKEDCENHFLHLSEILPLNTDESPYLQDIRKQTCIESQLDYKMSTNINFHL